MLTCSCFEALHQTFSIVLWKNVFNSFPKLCKWSKCDASKADWFSQAIIMLSGNKAGRRVSFIGSPNIFQVSKMCQILKMSRSIIYRKKFARTWLAFQILSHFCFFSENHHNYVLHVFISPKRIIITSTWWHRGCRRNITHR